MPIEFLEDLGGEGIGGLGVIALLRPRPVALLGNFKIVRLWMNSYYS